MNILCSRWNCKFRKENNSLQRLMICCKETVEVGKTGYCKSFVKNPMAKCEHKEVEWRCKNGGMVKVCTNCQATVGVTK